MHSCLHFFMSVLYRQKSYRDLQLSDKRVFDTKTKIREDQATVGYVKIPVSISVLDILLTDYKGGFIVAPQN